MAKQPPSAKAGLRGQDKQQAALRDRRGGTYDPVHDAAKPQHVVQERRTPHENAQPGADVRAEPEAVPEVDLPERLRRQPQGPYDRDKGRG